MRRIAPAVCGLALVVVASAAEAQSVRIPGSVRLKIRRERVMSALGPKAAVGVSPGALAGAATTGVANRNGPVIQAPVGRVEVTNVIVGDQIAVDQ